MYLILPSEMFALRTKHVNNADFCIFLCVMVLLAAIGTLIAGLITWNFWVLLVCTVCGVLAWHSYKIGAKNARFVGSIDGFALAMNCMFDEGKWHDKPEIAHRFKRNGIRKKITL